MPTKPKKPATLPIKLAGKLPKDPKFNGLAPVHAQLKAFGTATVAMTVTCSQVLKRFDGTDQPVMVIEHIEGLTGDLADRVQEAMDEARVARESDEGVMPGMDTGTLLRKAPENIARDPNHPDNYQPGTGQGAGWND